MKRKVNTTLRKRLEAEKVDELYRNVILSQIYFETNELIKSYLKESNND